jgi:hypothetical protein
MTNSWSALVGSQPAASKLPVLTALFPRGMTTKQHWFSPSFPNTSSWPVSLATALGLILTASLCLETALADSAEELEEETTMVSSVASQDKDPDYALSWQRLRRARQLTRMEASSDPVGSSDYQMQVLPTVPQVLSYLFQPTQTISPQTNLATPARWGPPNPSFSATVSSGERRRKPYDVRAVVTTVSLCQCTHSNPVAVSFVS